MTHDTATVITATMTLMIIMMTVMLRVVALQQSSCDVFFYR